MRPAVALVVTVVVLLHAASALLQSHPGFTDAYYYNDVAQRLARGEGLTADFAWSLLEATRPDAFPVPSHRFWMPASTVVQAIGIAVAGAPLGPLRAAQVALLLVVALVPLVAYAASRSLGAGERTALLVALLTGLGGILAPFWASLDSYAIAAAVGTAFFLAFARAARGDLRSGAFAGLCVGALFLTRGEGAVLGVALLALALRTRTRRAGLAGSAIALAIGAAWLARDLALEPHVDIFARSALLVRYDELFGPRDPTFGAFLNALPDVLAVKASALVTNAITFATVFLLVGVAGLALGVRRHRARPEVRAWLGLLVLVFLAESLVWTLHSTRGSYIHSLAAFIPFGVALAVDGATLWLASVADATTTRVAAVATLVGVSALSAFGVIAWHATYDPPARARADAVASLYPPRVARAPVLVVDAAAWRWIAPDAGPFLVTPPLRIDADCMAARGARILVLEPAHFAGWDEIYAGRTSPWVLRSEVAGGIRIYDYDPRSYPICGDTR